MWFCTWAATSNRHHTRQRCVPVSYFFCAYFAIVYIMFRSQGDHEPANFSPRPAISSSVQAHNDKKFSWKHRFWYWKPLFQLCWLSQIFFQGGGHNVTFDETLTFLDKQLMDSTLKVRVYDKGTLSDDILGEHDVNLNLQNLLEDSESKVARLRDAATWSAVGCDCELLQCWLSRMPTQAPVAFECVHKGKPAGKVFLSFSRKNLQSMSN